MKSQVKAWALTLGIAGGMVAGATPASALILDVYDSVDLVTPIGQITTIDTAETGQQHYSYSSASGHPSGVPLAPLASNVWVHQNTNNGELSFGFIFSQDNGVVSNNAQINFRIVDSLTNVSVVQSDDPGEATEVVPGAFQGVYFYANNTDGIMVGGISGNTWTIIIDSVDFGNIDTWNAASGDTNHLALTLGNEYRITPQGNPPSGAPVGGDIPAPATLVLIGVGLMGIGAVARRRRK